LLAIVLRFLRSLFHHSPPQRIHHNQCRTRVGRMHEGFLALNGQPDLA
jgi:hypothetical protein